MSTAAKLIQQQKNLLPINSPVPNRRVLVVDDEPEIAKGIHQILCPDQGKAAARSSRSLKTVAPVTSEFEVVVVHTPTDALKAIQSSLNENRPFAMGFFDVVLGADIDGIELVKQAFALDPRLFAVFVTAYHDRNVDAIGNFVGEENREKWDYINKPFTEGEILQKARNATSLWDLHRLKEWQAERLSAAHQLLLQNERLNAAAAVGRSVAHEFGNLLTHIVGHAELAMDHDDPKSLKAALEIILKAGDTATSVLKRFRRLNNAVEAAPEMKIVDLVQPVEEALELMEFRFRRHLITVDKTGLIKLGAEVNRNSLIQVLVNLFINAMHAMPDGGKIYLSIAPAEDNQVCIKVRDTGAGIPEDILPRVIEPLFTTKGEGGSGLGLAICKEIVEIEHNGEFRIENHPQGGVEVSLRLPVSQQEDENE